MFHIGDGGDPTNASSPFMHHSKSPSGGWVDGWVANAYVVRSCAGACKHRVCVWGGGGYSRLFGRAMFNVVLFLLRPLGPG
jgi:hypothetical protein